MYLLEIATGLRRGELLGLKWTDVNYDAGTIYIQRQICRIDGVVTEGPLKTKNSYRKIVIPSDVMAALKDKQKKDNGASEYVFFSPLTNGPISPDSVLHMLHRVLDRAGLPRIRFHDLRHTFATMALQNGVDVKTLSNILGHFSAGFTLDTFAPRKHCRPARLERVAVLCVCSLTRLRSIRHRRRSAHSPTSPPICSKTPRIRWEIF